MKYPGVRRCDGYLLADCGSHDPREVAERYRELAVTCIEERANCVLLKAVHGTAEGHRALRDALTMMILSGIPSGFRLALVTNVGGIQTLFLALQRDLRYLGIFTALFQDEEAAIEWLGVRRAPGRPADDGAGAQA